MTSMTVFCVALDYFIRHTVYLPAISSTKMKYHLSSHIPLVIPDYTMVCKHC